MTNDSIIADLLKKIDSLQETVVHQNSFIMRMATYRDDREDKAEEERDQRLKSLMQMAQETGLIEILYKWLRDERNRRPSYSAGQPDIRTSEKPEAESESEQREDFDS